MAAPTRLTGTLNARTTDAVWSWFSEKCTEKTAQPLEHKDAFEAGPVVAKVNVVALDRAASGLVPVVNLSVSLNVDLVVPQAGAAPPLPTAPPAAGLPPVAAAPPAPTAPRSR